MQEARKNWYSQDTGQEVYNTMAGLLSQDTSEHCHHVAAPEHSILQLEVTSEDKAFVIFHLIIPREAYTRLTNFLNRNHLVSNTLMY